MGKAQDEVIAGNIIQRNIQGADMDKMDKRQNRYLGIYKIFTSKVQDMCKLCTSDVIDNIQEHQGSIGKWLMDDGGWVGV